MPPLIKPTMPSTARHATIALNKEDFAADAVEFAFKIPLESSVVVLSVVVVVLTTITVVLLVVALSENIFIDVPHLVLV